MKESSTMELIQEHRRLYAASVEAIHLRMFNTDLHYHRADKAHIDECNKAKLAGTHVPENVTPPVVLEQTEAMVAYLAGIFINTFPIYKPKLAPGNEEAETTIEALMQKFQDENLWIGEELQAIRNIVKHNLAATIVSWKETSIKEALARVNAPSTYGLTNKTLSMYDCIWDTSIHPKDFQHKGLFFEHREYFTRLQAARVIADLPTEGTTKEGIKVVKAFASRDPKQKVHKHSRIQTLETLHQAVSAGYRHDSVGIGETNYKNFFDVDGGEVSEVPAISFEGFKVSTVYMRCTAKDLDIKLASGKVDSYGLYKLILVNDIVVWREELDLPTFEVVLSVGIIDDFGYNTKSVIEPINVFQDVATSFIKAKIAGARRSIHDRAIFNPLFVKASDVNSPEDGLKIPIRRSQWFTPNATSAAYRDIPFNDQTTRESIADAQLFMTTLPTRATGISEFRASPVRGNRTAEQFNLESKAADGRGYSLALTLEASRYAGIRTLMKAILIANQPNQTTIDWSSIGAELSFSITDGLSSLGMFDDLNNLQQFIQLASQNPVFTPMLEGILKHILSARTPFNITEFTKDEADDTGRDGGGNPATGEPPADTSTTEGPVTGQP